MSQAVLKATLREGTGKGLARKLRREKLVPAVIYGPGTAPQNLTLAAVELERLVRQHGAENAIIDLAIAAGDQVTRRKAMFREIAVDPLKDAVLHVDLYEISMDHNITVNVPVHLVNTPAGVKRGGILEPIRRELTITCLPGALVEALEVDVSGLDIGDSLHVRDIQLPDGLKVEEEPRLTVAVVAAPTVGEAREAVEEGEGLGETETGAEEESEA